MNDLDPMLLADIVGDISFRDDLDPVRKKKIIQFVCNLAVARMYAMQFIKLREVLNIAKSDKEPHKRVPDS